MVHLNNPMNTKRKGMGVNSSGRNQKAYNPADDREAMSVRRQQSDKPITKLRVALLEFGAPQYMVAARCGMSPSRISEYALGVKPIPTHHLLSLAELMHKNPADLVGEADVLDPGDLNI